VYGTTARRLRPDNRPQKIHDLSYSGLKEIDEFSGTGGSETQMIYSGHHSGSLEKQDSSVDPYRLNNSRKDHNNSKQTLGVGKNSTEMM